MMPLGTVLFVTKKGQREPSPVAPMSQLFEGAGELVGTGGAAAVAVNAVQAGDDIGHLHSGAE